MQSSLRQWLTAFCMSYGLERRTKPHSGGCTSNCSRQKPEPSAWSTTTQKWRRPPAATTTTMRTAISSTESRTLPAGLRLHRQRRPPIWLGVAALAGGGLVLGTVLAGAPPSAILGILAVLIAAGAAIYWPALGLAILAFTYPFDLVTYAGPIKVTSSAAMMAVLVLVLVARQFLRDPPPIQRTRLDL